MNGSAFALLALNLNFAFFLKKVILIFVQTQWSIASCAKILRGYRLRQGDHLQIIAMIVQV